MSAEVETRRFRTWDPDAGATPAQASKTILKYGALRLLRTWYIRLLLVLTLIFVVTMIGTYAFEVTQISNGLDKWAFEGAAGISLAVGSAYLLFVAAPLFSEDLRFNAHLFYFSKPVSIREYAAGKIALVLATLGVVVLLPFIIFLGLSFADAALAQPVDAWDGEPLAGDDAAWWDATSINSVGDWVLAVSFVLPGVIVLLAFLTSVFTCLSVWTKRAWHAGIGSAIVVVGWSILGFTAEEFTRKAIGSVWGPAGWFQTMIVSPLSFHWGYHRGQGNPTPDHLEGLGGAMPVAYLLCLAATGGFVALMLWKLRTVEANE